MLGFHLGGRLWHHQDFMRMWVGQSVSQVGNQVTLLALPTIAIILLGATTFQVGLLEAVGTIAFPLLGPFAGVWVDRFRRKPIMIVSNFGRMVSLLTIPISAFFGFLTIYQLFAVAGINGVFWVFFDTANQSYLPSLVVREDLIDANSRLQASTSGAQIIGPTLAGFLISVVGATRSIIADSVGYLVSAISLLSIKKKEEEVELTVGQENEDGSRKGDSTNSFIYEMKQGFHFVLRNSILSTLTACVATSNLGANVFLAVYLLFAYRELHLSPLLVGVIGTVAAVGFFIGVLTTNPVSGRLGVGRTLAVSSAGFLAYTGIALAVYLPSIPTLMVFLFISYMVLAPFNIVGVTLRQSITPNRFLGRVTATSRAISWGVLPVGSLIGGLLGTILGLQATVVIGGLVAALGSLWIVLGPVFKLKDQPRSVDLGDI